MANVTYKNETEENDPHKCQGIECYSVQVFNLSATATTFLAIFGVTSNFLTILAIMTSKLRYNVNSLLICNLCVAAFIYCSLVLPIQAVAFTIRKWPLTDLFCTIHAGIRTWLTGTSLMLLSCIAFYRYLNVVWPKMNQIFAQKTWFTSTVMFCWSFPFIFAVTPLINFWGEYDFQEEILQCTFKKNTNHKQVTITLGFIIPCTFIIVCYTRIGCLVIYYKCICIDNRSSYYKEKTQREASRITMKMLLILVWFIIGTSPYFIINTSDKDFKHPYIHIFASCLMWAMYAANTIIYTLMDIQFINAFKRLLLCKVFKTASEFKSSTIEPSASVHKQKSQKTLGTEAEKKEKDANNIRLGWNRARKEYLGTKDNLRTSFSRQEWDENDLPSMEIPSVRKTVSIAVRKQLKPTNETNKIKENENENG